MIIDLILDRKDGYNYNPKVFYHRVAEYGEIGSEIAEALDNGEEENVKSALRRYIHTNGYDMDIKNYINGVNWL